jgi:Leucine-rich repeat (LRR) protein
MICTLKDHQKHYHLSAFDKCLCFFTLTGAPFAIRHWQMGKETFKTGHRIIACIQMMPVLGIVAAAVEKTAFSCLSSRQASHTLDSVTTQIEPMPESLQAWAEFEGGQALFAAEKVHKALLSKADHLDLHGLQLTSLPQAICDIQSLKRINLGHNLLEQFPECFYSLPQLQDVDLTCNMIQKLKITNYFHPLRSLFLAENPLDTIEITASPLTFLKFLDLSKCQLQFIPDSLAKLTGLQLLKLNSNYLSSFAGAINGLKDLRGLDLSCNVITQAEKLELPQLHTLDLTDNRLIEIPEGFFEGIPQLQKLCLADNHLKKISSEIWQLSALTELYLMDNDLESLPDTIGLLRNLRLLYVSRNELTILPAQIVELEKLQRLFFSNNRVRSWPADMLGLKSLEEMSIFGNPDLPKNRQLLALPKLKTLYLEDCSLTPWEWMHPSR